MQQHFVAFLIKRILILLLNLASQNQFKIQQTNKPVVCSDTFFCVEKWNYSYFRLYESDLGCRFSYTFMKLHSIFCFLN